MPKTCIGDHWVNSDGQHVACAYEYSFAVAGTTRERHILELPTEAVVRLFQLITGPVGNAMARSYFAEGANHRYTLNMEPPEEASDYRYVTHSHRVSERGAKDWAGPNVPSDGYWQWELRKQSAGTGRSWYNAAWVNIYSHPSIENPDIDWCQNFCDVVVDRINAELHASFVDDSVRPETGAERQRREDMERDWQNRV